MARINWGRMLAGGLIAAIIAFFTDGFLHERLLSADWKALYDNLRASAPSEQHGSEISYFVVFELGRGLVSIFVYVMMRPHFGPGPKTAALAGVVAWIAFSVTGPAQFIPLGFFSNTLWAKAMVFQLVTSVLAAIAGAALYKDAVTSPAKRSGTDLSLRLRPRMPVERSHPIQSSRDAEFFHAEPTLSSCRSGNE